MFVKYQTFEYYHASSLNSRLYDIVCDNVDHSTAGGGSITLKDLHKRELKDVDKLLTWVKQVIPQCACNFANQVGSKYEELNIGVGGEGGFRPHAFEIPSCWGIHYDKGQGVVKHNHFPYAISFSYCVKAPEGSSPLVIEGEQMMSVEGQLICFLSHQFHWVPKSEVNGRCMIVGNILYTP